MSDWDTPAAASGWVDDSAAQATGGWLDDTSAAADLGGDSFSGINPEHISKHDESGNDNACRNCGQDGHWSKDCPEPRQMTGECFNCGQIGHNKTDCTNEAVERPFTGTCRNCGEEGHRGSDCPKVECRVCGLQGHRASACSQAVCKKCKNTGHNAADCTDKYDIYPVDLPKIEDADQAWENLLDADAKGDVDDFLKAFWLYCKLAPELTLVQLEECFRETNFQYYLIAKEQMVPSVVHTNVDLQGVSGKKYVVSIQKTAKPRRAVMAEGWPKTPEENLERLQDAGFPMDRMVTICSNCGHEGHIRKNCPQEAEVIEKPKVTCSNCNTEGHYIRDCPEPRVVRGGAADVECKHCGEVGHFARDCPNKPSQACRNCLQDGHKAAECPNERVIVCRNCKAPGHTARDCEEPVNMDNVKCNNCEKYGHFKKECPEPTDWSKVQCRACNEFGHGAARCPGPKEDAGIESVAGDYTTAGGAADATLSGDWMTSGDSGAAGAEDWNSAPAAVSAW